jgi:hypothetical protein
LKCFCMKKTFVIVTFDFLSNCHSLLKNQNGKKKFVEFWSENKNNWGIRKKTATKRFKFEAWCIKISDFRKKKQRNLRNRIGERASNKKTGETEYSN